MVNFQFLAQFPIDHLTYLVVLAFFFFFFFAFTNNEMNYFKLPQGLHLLFSFVL